MPPGAEPEEPPELCASGDADGERSKPIHAKAAFCAEPVIAKQTHIVHKKTPAYAKAKKLWPAAAAKLGPRPKLAKNDALSIAPTG
jgi:hypothetical protein